MHFTCIVFSYLLLALARPGQAGTTTEMMYTMSNEEEVMGSDSGMPDFHGYGETNLEAFFVNLAFNYSNLATLYSIGNTTDGNPINVICISNKPSGMTDADMEQVALIGAVHGNEPVTREILLHFAHHLVTHSSEADVAALLSKAMIHIMPEFNIDGARLAFQEYGNASDCTGMVGRNNSDGLDLAKSFVGVHLPEGNTTTMGNDSAANDTTTEAAQMGEVEQSEEITNFKNWLMDKSFKLSATFFTGNGLYVEYPHFGLEENGDDDWAVLQHLSQTYVEAHPDMATGTSDCPNGDGTLNGMKSMVLEDTTMMLNYMYRNHDIYAVDVHLGCCNYDGLNEVMGYVNDNKDSLMQFCSLVLDDANFVRQADSSTNSDGAVAGGDSSTTLAPGATNSDGLPISGATAGDGTGTTVAGGGTGATSGNGAAGGSTAKQGPANVVSDSDPITRKSSTDKKLSNGAIAGIVVGTVLVVGGGAAAIVATGATAGAAGTGAAGAGAGAGATKAAGTTAAATPATSSAANVTSSSATNASSAAEAGEAAQPTEAKPDSVEKPESPQQTETPSPEAESPPQSDLEPSDFDDAGGRVSPV